MQEVYRFFDKIIVFLQNYCNTRQIMLYYEKKCEDTHAISQSCAGRYSGFIEDI